MRTLGVTGSAIAFALGLGCGGAGTAAPPDAPADPTSGLQPVPIVFAGGRARAFPIGAVAGSPLAAIDADVNTVWEPQSGEVGTFYGWRGQAAGLWLRAEAEAVELRTVRVSARLPPKVLETGPWVRLPLVEGELRHAFDAPSHGVELRFDALTRVSSVSLVHPTPATWRRSEQAQLHAAVYGDGAPAFALEQARFGEVRLGDSCTVLGRDPGPGEGFEGRCAPVEGALRLEGTLSGLGALAETLPVVEVSDCVVLVEGLPYARCGGGE